MPEALEVNADLDTHAGTAARRCGGRDAGERTRL
jgi:hypothetical protein